MATPVAARPLSIAESASLLGTCGRVVSLLALDEMWSDYLTAAQESRIDEIDFAGLVELSGLMHDGLGELAEIGPSASNLVNSQYDETLFAGLQRLKEQYGPAELFDWVLGDEVAGGSLRELFVSAWTEVLENIPDECEILEAKRDTLSNGDLCDPDFRFRFKCLLVVAGLGAGAVLAGAGTVATLGLGASVGLGALVVVGGTALAWKDSGCGKEVNPAAG